MSTKVPFPATFVPAKKNGGKFLETPDNHAFLKNSQRGDKMYFQCQNKKKDCKATAIVTNNNVVEYIDNHNHDSNILEKRVK